MGTNSRLKDKVALISGAASGIGAAHAKVFASEGAKVVIADIQEEKAGEVLNTITESGGEAIFINLDVTDKNAWNSCVTEALKAYGKLDILINNAGIFHPGGLEEETEEGQCDEWSIGRCIVNMRSGFHVCGSFTTN